MAASKGFSSHYRAVHFFLGQAAKRLGDVVVGQLFCVLQLHALEHFGEHGRGGNSRSATKSFEFCIGDYLIFINLDGQPQGITAGDGTDIANTVGILDLADIFWVDEMFLDLICIFPHDGSLC